MVKVILDPGHGGRDIGDYYENRSEKNDNLLLTLRIGEFLEMQGIEVAYTRKTDIYLTTRERITMIKETCADLMISLHRSSKKCYTAGYCLDFSIKENDLRARNAAVTIGSERYPVGYATCKFIVRKDLTLLNEVSVPAIMLHIGYIRTGQEHEYYHLNFVAIAETIARGILNYLKKIDCHQNVLLKPMSLCYRYRVMVGRYCCYDEAAREQLYLCGLGIVTEMECHNRRSFILYTGEMNQLNEAVFLEGELKRLGYRTMITIV